MSYIIKIFKIMYKYYIWIIIRRTNILWKMI